MSKSTGIDPETLLARSESIMATEMEGETVMMSLEQGMYYHLDSVGTDVWAALEEPRTFEDLVGHLRREYEVPAEQCRRELAEFLQDLLDSEILRRA